MAEPRRWIEELLAEAGIRVGGNGPADIVVHDERLWNRVIRYGSLGLGEAYMDGWWNAPHLDQFIAQLLRARADKKFKVNAASLYAVARAFLFNLQSPRRAFIVGEEHYDLGNDLYEAMLDPRMTYTCGYWSGEPPAQNLAQAQEAKLDLVCRKLRLKKGDRVLDIGCGWGSFATWAAERYGASVVGITVSVEQAALAQKRSVGLPVEIRVQDYREVNEPFDHIVSLGMFEHVGVKNYRRYFTVARRCLAKDGLFLLHTIGSPVSEVTSDPWITKYIFPGGQLPSIAQTGKAIEGLFVVEDLHNFGADYDKTLMAWFHNVDAAWPRLKGAYSERFYRMWKYYLLSCAGTFRARTTHLWQFVLSPTGVSGGYKSVR